MISIAELKQNFSNKSMTPSFEGEEYLKQFMNDVDMDNDGYISFEEFNNGLTSVFLNQQCS